jgi:hypothetical protein
MTKCVNLFVLLTFVSGTWCEGQNTTNLPKQTAKSEAEEVISSHGPSRITRNIIQDRKGNIWIAAFGRLGRLNSVTNP